MKKLIFPTLMSCNNGDYEFTKTVCKIFNLSFTKRYDHLKCVNQTVNFPRLHFVRGRLGPGRGQGFYTRFLSSAGTLLGLGGGWARAVYRLLLLDLLFVASSLHHAVTSGWFIVLGSSYVCGVCSAACMHLSVSTVF